VSVASRVPGDLLIVVVLPLVVMAVCVLFVVLVTAGAP
jgi:hypothetical protein